MNLHEWASKQPLQVQRHKKYFNSFHVPDDPTLVDRWEAWHLEDYCGHMRRLLLDLLTIAASAYAVELVITFAFHMLRKG